MHARRCTGSIEHARKRPPWPVAGSWAVLLCRPGFPNSDDRNPDCG